MLKQDAVPEPPLTVSQMRVTPDELTQALAAIEARRQADAGTIPLDQAVSELHLDSTSDEIWAEVQAQRAKVAAARQKPAPAAQAAPVSGLRGRDHLRRRGLRRLVAPAVVIGLLMSAGIIPHNFTPHGFSPSLITKAAAPTLRPLSAVPDGKEVYADDAALIQISEGKPAAQVVISENATGNRWNLVKTGGHVYLRGYIESASSFQSLRCKPLNVYNDDNSGELEGNKTSNITLRVDNIPLQKSGGDSDYSSLTVPNFQPDSVTTLTPGR